MQLEGAHGALNVAVHIHDFPPLEADAGDEEEEQDDEAEEEEEADEAGRSHAVVRTPAQHPKDEEVEPVRPVGASERPEAATSAALL